MVRHSSDRPDPINITGSSGRGAKTVNRCHGSLRKQKQRFYPSPPPSSPIHTRAARSKYVQYELPSLPFPLPTDDDARETQRSPVRGRTQPPPQPASPTFLLEELLRPLERVRPAYRLPLLVEPSSPLERREHLARNKRHINTNKTKQALVCQLSAVSFPFAFWSVRRKRTNENKDKRINKVTTYKRGFGSRGETTGIQCDRYITPRCDRPRGQDDARERNKKGVARKLQPTDRSDRSTLPCGLRLRRPPRLCLC